MADLSLLEATNFRIITSSSSSSSYYYYYYYYYYAWINYKFNMYKNYIFYKYDQNYHNN